jgi:hypothetical protein
MQTVGTGEVVGGRNEREVAANDRRLLAEADYERVAQTKLVGVAGFEVLFLNQDALFVDIILNTDTQAGLELAKRAVELKPRLKVVCRFR